MAIIPLPPAESSVIDWIRDIDVPVVLVEWEPIRGGATSAWSAVTDVEIGIVSAINHVIELGHERIGLAIPSNAQPWRRIRQTWQEYLGSCGHDTDVPVLCAEESSFSSARESGFIDGILDTITAHNLTAVSPPKSEIGELAARTLLERLSTSTIASPRQCVLSPD